MDFTVISYSCKKKKCACCFLSNATMKTSQHLHRQQLFLILERRVCFLRFSGLLPDKRLQDERRRAFLKLQLFVMQRFGVGTTFGSSLSKQHNAVIISEGQRALKKENTLYSYFPYQIKLEWTVFWDFYCPWSAISQGFTISATYCLAKISLIVLFFKEILKHSRQSNSSSPIYSLGLLHWWKYVSVFTVMGL